MIERQFKECCLAHEQTRLEDVAEATVLRRNLMFKVKSGLASAVLLSNCSEVKSVRYFAVRNQLFSKGIVGLFNMGYWPDQIIDYIDADDLNTVLIMAVLRRYFRKLKPEVVMASYSKAYARRSTCKTKI